MSKNNKLDDMTMNGPVGKLLPRKEKKTPSAADNTPRIIAKKSFYSFGPQEDTR